MTDDSAARECTHDRIAIDRDRTRFVVDGRLAHLCKCLVCGFEGWGADALTGQRGEWRVSGADDLVMERIRRVK